MKIFIKQIYDKNNNKIPVTLPTKGSDVAAGYDIIATSEPKIVGEKIDDFYERIDYIEYETNLFIAPESKSFHVLIHPRSSVSKYNLTLANSIGLIDNDYRGMIMCRFQYQWQPQDFRVQTGGETGYIRGKPNMERIYKKGDAIAQLVIEPTVMVTWELVDELDSTKRGSGAFGSTTR